MRKDVRMLRREEEGLADYFSGVRSRAERMGRDGVLAAFDEVINRFEPYLRSIKSHDLIKDEENEFLRLMQWTSVSPRTLERERDIRERYEALYSSAAWPSPELRRQYGLTLVALLDRVR